MINTTLFKQELKNNYKSFILFLSIITMYVVIVIMMYDPLAQSILDQFSSTMPSLFEAFGMQGTTSDFLSFLINYLYGFILLLLPMVYSIYLNYKLIIHYIESKSLNYILSSSLSRKSFIQTQYYVCIFMFLIFTVYITLLTFITSHYLFESLLSIHSLLYLNIGLFSLHFLIISIICFISIQLNDCKKAILYSSLFITVNYLLSILVAMQDSLWFFKYINVFQLFHASNYLTVNLNNNLCIFIMLITGFLLQTITIRHCIHRDFII